MCGGVGGGHSLYKYVKGVLFSEWCVSSLQTGKGFKCLSGKWFMPGKGLVFFKIKKTEIN